MLTMEPNLSSIEIFESIGKTQQKLGSKNCVIAYATAALLLKSRKTLHRPVRFSGFKSVRILCFCSYLL